MKPPRLQTSPNRDDRRTAARLLREARGEDVPTIDVFVRNDSYQTVPAFGILGVGGSVVAPENESTAFDAQSRRTLLGYEPSPALHRGKWVALKQPLAPGETGEAVLIGLAVVRVYVNDPADEYCDVISAKTVCEEVLYLGTGPGGARILWLDNTCGAGWSAWAVVRVEEAGDTWMAVEPTTTPIPDCSGTCKWVWSASLDTWELEEDACSPPTTTTPTPEVCHCPPTTTTTVDPEATTTTAEPTTTTPAPCQCVCPPYKGDNDGEVYVGQCAAAGYQMDDRYCGTTTTGDPGTTTEDPCCKWLSTSTTTVNVCSGGCDWWWDCTGSPPKIPRANNQ